jgi:hypothetical protein
MDHGISKVLTLNEGSKDIVCANLDFWKKLNIIRSAVALQFEDKDKELVATLNKVMEINNYRQTVIHSTFEAGPNDNVRFSRVIAKNSLERQTQDWDPARFHQRFETMGKIKDELERLVTDLKPYTPSLDFSDSRNSMYLVLL